MCWQLFDVLDYLARRDTFHRDVKPDNLGVRRHPKRGSSVVLFGFSLVGAACFWLKQLCHDKGNRGGERSTGRYAWENYFDFTGTKLEQFPLPPGLPLSGGRRLDSTTGRRISRGAATGTSAASLTSPRNGSSPTRGPAGTATAVCSSATARRPLTSTPGSSMPSSPSCSSPWNS
jgi:serine/threonine protein kinase